MQSFILLLLSYSGIVRRAQTKCGQLFPASLHLFSPTRHSRLSQISYYKFFFFFLLLIQEKLWSILKSYKATFLVTLETAALFEMAVALVFRNVRLSNHPQLLCFTLVDIKYDKSLLHIFSPCQICWAAAVAKLMYVFGFWEDTRALEENQHSHR